MTDVFTTVYMSSGRKNAMRTLRIRREGGEFFNDNYLCNLCRDPEEAEEKARDYFDRVFGDRALCVFQADDMPLNDWGAPDPWMVPLLKAIEDGFMPFGKHEGEKIEDQDDGYVLWWAEQEITENTKLPAAALIDRFKGIALERNLYKKREKREAEWAAKRAASSYIGEVDTRQRFSAVVETVTCFENSYCEDRCVQRLRSGDDLIVYWGWAELGEVGDAVEFDARVKKHDEYKDEKQTVVNRPTKIDIEKKGEAK
jgi:hypothetical protein